MLKKINVLMITGVYFPEINGAVLQSHQLIVRLKKSINFTILTNTNKKCYVGKDYIDEVPIYRVFSPKDINIKRIISFIYFYILLCKLILKVDIVHIHGFSKRNAIVILITKILRKKVIVKMTSYRVDDPLSIKNSSYILWKIFKLCHGYIGISPAFSLSFEKTELLASKYYFIPNGVDLDKFKPISAEEKKILRNKYGFSEKDKIIIFIGHFSTEKRPIFLYNSWTNLYEHNYFTKLIFIGRTKNHFEVDNRIVEIIKEDATKRGIISEIIFIEETLNIDHYMKIADLFVLTSIREGLPNSLLEAMACGLPCVVCNLPNVTDWLIRDSINGFLFDQEDSDILEEKISIILESNFSKRSMGILAREFIEINLSCDVNSQKVLDLYNIIFRYSCTSI